MGHNIDMEQIKANKDEFIKKGYNPTDIIFPIPKNYPEQRRIIIGDKELIILDTTKCIGTIWGMNIWVDEKITTPILIDATQIRKINGGKRKCK